MKRTGSQLLLDGILGLGIIACAGGSIYKLIDSNERVHSTQPNTFARHVADVEAVQGGALGLGFFSLTGALLVVGWKQEKPGPKPACPCDW